MTTKTAAAVPLLIRVLDMPMSTKRYGSARATCCNPTCDVELTYFYGAVSIQLTQTIRKSRNSSKHSTCKTRPGRPLHRRRRGDHQIVPIGTSALRSSKLVKGSTLKVYPGAPHSLFATHKDAFNADLLTFIRA